LDQTVGRGLDQALRPVRDLADQEIAEQLGQIRDEAGHVAASHHQLVYQIQGGGSIAPDQGIGELQQGIVFGQAGQGQDIVPRNGSLAAHAGLVQETDRIPQRAVGKSRDRLQSAGINGDPVGCGDFAQPGGDAFDRNTAEIITLAAGQDGRRDAVRLGGRQNEYGVGRWLLERFEQGIESPGGQHMDFVDDVNLVRGFGRHEIDFIGDPADIVDTVIGGGVHFHDIEQRAVENATADFALVAGIAVLGILAIDRP